MQHRVDRSGRGPTSFNLAARGGRIHVSESRPSTRLSEASEKDTKSSVEEMDEEVEGEEDEFEYEEEIDVDEEYDDEWYEDDEEEEDDNEGEEGLAATDGESSGGMKGVAEGLEEEEMVEVGIVIGAHGVRGEVRVKPLTDFPEERFGQVR